DLLSGGALSETTGDSLSVGTLAASVASASLIGSNAVGTLGAISAHGGFTLTDEENLTLAGPIRATGGAVQLNDAGFAISESGGSISAETLGIGAPTAVVQSASLTGNNVIGTLDAVSVSGGFTLANAEDLTLAGLLDAGNVQLNDPGFAITEQGGSIEAGFFTGSGASATLNGANQIGTLGAFAASNGGFSLTEAGGQTLTVTGAVTVAVGQTIALTVDGLQILNFFPPIFAGSLSAPGGTVQLAPYTASNAVALIESGSVGAGTLAITGSDLGGVSANILQIGASGGGPIIIGNPGDTVAIPNVTTLRLESTGGVTEQGALSVGALEGTVGSAALTGSNTIASLGDFTLSGGSFSLTDQVPLGITGAVSAVGNGVTFTINGGGNIAEQTGGSITAGTLTGSAASASFNEANTIGSLGAFAAADGFILTDQDPLTITGVLNASSGQAIFVINGGNLSESGAGAIRATTLSGSTGNGASLTGPNNSIGTLAAFDSSAGGTFNLEDKSPLTVTGKVAVPSGSVLAIEADTLTISGGMLSAPGGIVQLAPYTTANAVALVGNGSAPAGTLAITKDDLGGVDAAVLQIGTAAGGAIIIGDATGPAVTIPSGLVLDLVSGSGVTEIGALSVGTLEGTVGSATLTAANNITTLGNFFASSGGFSLTEDKTIPLLVSGPVSVPSGQTIALTADGIALGSGGSLSAPNGSVTLASAKPGLSLDLTTGQASAAVGTFSLGDTSPNTAAISAATLAVGAADGGGITVTGAIALPDIGLLDLLSGGAVSETTADS
ncbi:MAG: beta strand repeat-containing protein, partial [Acetobacteraceae bacterium]